MINRMPFKCERCRKPVNKVTMILSNGANGFRLYPFCLDCEKIITKETYQKISINKNEMVPHENPTIQ